LKLPVCDPSTDNFRQPKEKLTPKDPAKDKKEGEEHVEKKENPSKKRALGKKGNKLPAVPESVLKSRKRRDLVKATRLKAALKVISDTFHIVTFAECFMIG
jgi:hypothetical protein